MHLANPGYGMNAPAECGREPGIWHRLAQQEFLSTFSVGIIIIDGAVITGLEAIIGALYARQGEADIENF